MQNFIFWAEKRLHNGKFMFFPKIINITSGKWILFNNSPFKTRLVAINSLKLNLKRIKDEHF